MDVKIKKLNNNVTIPKYAHEGDAGLDLIATSFNLNNSIFEYGIGFAIEIPKGYVGLIYPRSSICNYNLYLTNSVGVIDSGYRGEIKLKFSSDTMWYTDDNNTPCDENTNNPLNIYKVGDKIAQLVIVPHPKINLIPVEKLTDTERGVGGYGSTGK